MTQHFILEKTKSLSYDVRGALCQLSVCNTNLLVGMLVKVAAIQQNNYLSLSSTFRKREFCHKCTVLLDHSSGFKQKVIVLTSQSEQSSPFVKLSVIGRHTQDGMAPRLLITVNDSLILRYQNHI